MLRRNDRHSYQPENRCTCIGTADMTMVEKQLNGERRVLSANGAGKNDIYLKHELWFRFCTEHKK